MALLVRPGSGSLLDGLKRRERAIALAALAAFAAALTATAVHGVFTVDEDNYLVNVVALRAARLTVPGTDGLPPTRELLAFDPGLDERGDIAIPVASTAPPLYAPLAFPFSFFGWYGLVAVNALALAGTAAAVYAVSSRLARRRDTPYFAAATVLFGGYAIEYAQGVWPHMLSMALVFGAFACAVRSEARRAAWLAGMGGLLAGLACGVRYPNAIIAAALLAGLLGLSGGGAWRWRASAAFAAGLAPPVLVSSLMNRARLGHPNPIQKGGGYLQPGEAYASRWLDSLRCAVARFVDFTAQAPLTGHAARVHLYMQRSPGTGAYLIGGAVKKAWLQSMPWVGLALVVLVVSSRPRADPTRAFPMRLAGLVVFGILSAVAVSGSSRVDGLCFNQRYLIDLLPLAATALALAFDDLPRRPMTLAALAAGGAASAALLAFVFSRDPGDVLRQELLMKAPLLLAALLLGGYAVRGRPAGAVLASGALAACLAWSLGVHLGDDLPASRRLRETNEERLGVAASVVKGPAAVFAFWGGKDAFGPLALDRDVLVVDVWPDHAESAPALRDAFLQQGRSVYVALPMPDDVLQRVAGGHALGTPRARYPLLLHLMP